MTLMHLIAFFFQWAQGAWDRDRESPLHTAAPPPENVLDKTRSLLSDARPGTWAVYQSSSSRLPIVELQGG